jgi:hypothetical protein
MSEQYAIVPFVAQAEPIQLSQEFEPRLLAEQYGSHLLRFLSPLAKELHSSMDIRPLRTLVQTVEALVAFRDSTHGLLLTELGSHLDGLGRGGGTKRLGTLIRHRKWKARQIDTFLWQRADAKTQAVGTAWGGWARHLGWDGVRKAGKSGARGIVRGAVEQSGSTDARQTGLLSSAWCSHFRARDAWDRSALSRSASQPGTSEFDQHALVEFTWSAGQSRKG